MRLTVPLLLALVHLAPAAPPFDPKAIDQLADDAIEATERAANKAERGVESARHFANEALDKADDKVRSLREDIKPAIDAVSSRVQDIAARGKAACAPLQCPL